MTSNIPESSQTLLPVVLQSRQASLQLAHTASTDRNRALVTMAKMLQAEQDAILEANTLDLEASREMAVPELILEWLKLTPERLQTTIKALQHLATLPDPLLRVGGAYHLAKSCQMSLRVVPLGVIALIYEALPELGVLAAGLCIKTGNSLILKGGTEASHSNRLIANVLQSALAEAGLPPACLELLPSDLGSATRELVTQNQSVSLVIPYGRPSLVQQVIRQATVPVLKTAMANCYLYWEPSATLDLVRWMILDSHRSEPDPVNAIEKVLVHRSLNPASLSILLKSLQDKAFEIRADAELRSEYPELKATEAAEWKQAYLNHVVAFKFVDNLETAIDWINTHSSGHADCIATESYLESHRFATQVNSACTYINTSSRFSRNPELGSAIALGMSAQRGERWGPITLETLTTLSRVIQGDGDSR